MWTFAYDVSGISSVTFNYRQDKDGINPLNDISNEVYRSGMSPVTLRLCLPCNLPILPLFDFCYRFVPSVRLESDKNDRERLSKGKIHT